MMAMGAASWLYPANKLPGQAKSPVVDLGLVGGSLLRVYRRHQLKVEDLKDVLNKGRRKKWRG